MEAGPYYCSTTHVGVMHDEDRFDTYDRDPEDDLACLLLFRARSLSPCVRPFLSSSSLYCKTENYKTNNTKLCFLLI